MKFSIAKDFKECVFDHLDLIEKEVIQGREVWGLMGCVLPFDDLFKVVIIPLPPELGRSPIDFYKEVPKCLSQKGFADNVDHSKNWVHDHSYVVRKYPTPFGPLPAYIMVYYPEDGDE